MIELKAGEFKPEYVGKLNFYLSAVDDQLRAEGDRHGSRRPGPPPNIKDK